MICSKLVTADSGESLVIHIVVQDVDGLKLYATAVIEMKLTTTKPKQVRYTDGSYSREVEDQPQIKLSEAALKPLEETIYQLSVKIANHEETYPLLKEFALKLLMIAGVKIK